MASAFPPPAPAAVKLHPPTILAFGDSNTFGANATPGGFRYGPAVRWPGVLQGLLGKGGHVVEAGLNGRTCNTDDPQCTWLPPNPGQGELVNGRRHLLACLHSHKPLDVVIIALGVNDLKDRFHLSPRDIAAGMALLCADVRAAAAKGVAEGGIGQPQVLIVSPAPPPAAPTPNMEQWGFTGAHERALALEAEYARVADEAGPGVFFLSAREAVAGSGDADGGGGGDNGGGGAGDGDAAIGADGIHLTPAGHARLGGAVAAMLKGVLGLKAKEA